MLKTTVGGRNPYFPWEIGPPAKFNASTHKGATLDGFDGHALLGKICLRKAGPDDPTFQG
jgi:hypothetical protein